MMTPDCVHSPARTKVALRRSLGWAVLASAAVHAGLIAVTVGTGHGAGQEDRTGPIIVALDARKPAPAPAPPAPAPVAVPRPEAPPAMSSAVLQPPPPSAVPRSLQSGGNGGNTLPSTRQVEGEPLVDRDKLGDLGGRQLTEFPVEIDSPVHLDGHVRAPYPLNALREGRDGVVAVWVVVNEAGRAEEIQVTEGDPEFAEGVVESLKEARFVPARNNLQPIRFPIALEFRFTTGEGSTPPTAATPTPG